jgi:hypothetical protein
MSQHALELPVSLFELAKKCAKEDKVSLNQFFVVAIAEKVSALKTAEYFRDRDNQEGIDHYYAILDKVPDRPLMPGDELPDDWDSRPSEPVQRRTRKTKATVPRPGDQ